MRIKKGPPKESLPVLTAVGGGWHALSNPDAITAVTSILLGYEILMSQDAVYPSLLTWPVIPALLGFTFCPITRLQLE